MNRKSVAQTIAIFTLGIGLGALALALVTPPSPTQQREAGGGDTTITERVVERHLIERVSSPTGGPTSPAALDPSLESALDEVSEPESVAREFASDLDLHSRDGRDVDWAPQAEQDLRHDIEAISGTFEVRALDCRTSTCSARIAWPSAAEASREFGRILDKDYDPNCAVKVLLDSTRENREADVLFECSDARAGL